MSRRLLLVTCGLAIFAVAVIAWRLRAAKSLPDHGTGSHRATAADAAAEVSPDAAAQPGDIPTPDRERDLHGIVVAPPGRPLAGARVRALESPLRRVYAKDYREWPSREVAAGVTDAEGAFRLRLRPGQVVTLRAEADGFASREFPGCLAGRRVRIEMSAGARVIAVVTSNAGKPVDGAIVELESEEEGRFERRFQRKRTDAEGKAAFEGVPSSGDARLDVWHHVAGAGFRRVDLKADGDVRVEIELEPTMTVRGRVTEAKSGAPIAGARVRQDRFPRESTLTDADGRYSLSGVHPPRKQDPDSEETVCLSGEGGLVAEARGLRPEHHYPDEDGITDFALEPAARVEGRVVDPGGNPVGGASVAAARDQLSPDDYRTTGADGRFSIDGLYAATVYLLLVNADGFGLVALEFDAPAEGESRDLGDLRLALPCTLAGRVVSATGEPVADVRVELEGSPDDRCRLRPGEPSESEPEEGAVTDNSGRFSFPGLAPGEFTVRADGDCDSAKATIRVAEGTRADIELRLPAVIRFRAVVVDETGAPQAGVTVEAEYGGNARGYGGSGRRGLTDAAGGVSFTVGTKRPNVRVHSGPAGWEFVAPGAVPVPVDATEVRIVVKPGLRTGGIVVDEAGKPVGHAQVEAWRDEESVASVFCNEAGEFSFLATDGPPVDLFLTGEVYLPDEYRRETQLLQGELRGARPGDTRLRIPAVRPPRDTTLDLRIVGPGKVPAGGCTVRLRGPQVDEDRELGADGCARFTEMPRVELHLTVFPADDSGLCWWAGRVTPAGREFLVELARELRFTGKVVENGGPPSDTFKVEIRSGDCVLDWTRTEDEGSFVLSIPEGSAGPFTLVAWDDNSDLTGRVENVKAGDSPVTVPLAPTE